MKDWAKLYQQVPTVPCETAFSLYLAKYEERSDFCAIAISGESDVYSSEQIREKLLECVEELFPGGILVVELSKVPLPDGTNSDGVAYIDSSGLGALVGALKRCNEKEITLLIVCEDNRAVSKVLEITGLEKVFEPFSRREEAIEAAAQIHPELAVQA